MIRALQIIYFRELRAHGLPKPDAQALASALARRKALGVPLNPLQSQLEAQWAKAVAAVEAKKIGR